jgi:outer membrane protein OmpA-like peptidoglycan-associated protein
MLAAATVLGGLPFVAANAQPVSGVYVGAGVGLNKMLDEEIGSSVTAGGVSTGEGHLQSRLGPAAVVSLGYGLGNGLRLELEGSYRNNQFNSASGMPGLGSLTDGGGREQKYGAMVNVLYDFVGLTPWFQPYVGAGAGYQWANMQDLHAGGPLGSVSFGKQTEGAFAWQVMVGAAVPIQSVPGLALTAEYRFMGLAGDRKYSGIATTAAGTVPVTAKLTRDYNNSVLLGIRYNFGQTPPPPPPAPAAVPAQAPTRSYLVFFDWDKATLTDRARQIIREAAENSTRVQYTRIEVNGYTDTSGTPKYNQGLSVRRAQAVAAELVKNGVPRNAISIQGFGDTHLLVPTGPGVREPQNRRVEIIIR